MIFFKDGKRHFAVIEHWESQEALEKDLQSPHFKVIRNTQKSDRQCK